MKRLILGLLAGLFLLPAQRLDGQNLSQVYRMTPRAGSGAAVQAALRSHTAWRAEQGDPWSWNVFEEVQGPNLGDWIVVSAGHSWEELDAYDRGFGPRGAQHFASNVGPLLEEVTSEITAVDPNLTNQPQDVSGYTLFHVTTWDLVTTLQPVFNESVGRIIESYDQGGATYHRTYYDVLMGPNQPRKRSVRWYRDWGDFANAPTPGTSVVAAFGQEEATSIFDAFRESVESTQDYVLRLHPEMAVPGM